jgi:WS/DGAT/MGAT family acyltransferase
MAEELSAADRSALAAEQGDVNMAVGGILVFEGGPGLDQAEITRRIDERLHLLPRYRQRLKMLAPGVTNPVWVDDDAFAIDWHLRSAALSKPGSYRQLADVFAREMSRRLDRTRPLWEMTIVEGVTDRRTALVPKMHHALVDGVAAVDIGTVLLDPSREPLHIPAPDGPWEPRPYDRARHLARLGMTPIVRAQQLAWESAQRALIPDPRRTATDLIRATELVTQLARTRPSAPMTPLNRPIGPNRSYAMLRVELADIKRAGKAYGGTINDVILAAVTGMLRRYLMAADVRLDAAPVALVPVSVRKEGEEGGNRMSTVLVDLPVDDENPLRRVATINATMSKLKDSAAVRAGALLLGAAGWAPPLVSGSLARAMSGVRAFNLVVSNVPGPQQPFFLNGHRLLEAYPAVPLNPGNQGLSVGVLSYDGGVHFGLLADRDLDPPVEVAAEHLRAGLDELLVARYVVK